MSERIEIDAADYAELLDTVRGLQRYAHAGRQYLPLHLGTNMVELARDAVDLTLRAQVVRMPYSWWEREAQ